MEENGEKAGEAHKATERETVEEAEPCRVRFAEDGSDAGPSEWLALTRTIFGKECEEKNDEQDRKHREGEGVGVAEFLRQARGEERGDERAGIPRAGDAHDEALVFGRIPFSGKRQGYGETRAAYAEQESKKEKLTGRVGEAPTEKKWNEREAETEHPGVAAADAITKHAENGTKKRAAEQGNCGEQSFLRGAEMHLLAKERRERTEEYPHHEADVEVQEGSHERGEVA